MGHERGNRLLDQTGPGLPKVPKRPLIRQAFALCSQRMGKRVTKKSKREFMDALKAWRSSHGLSQSQAAEHLGVPLKTLQNWEIARTKPQGFAQGALLKLMAKSQGHRGSVLDFSCLLSEDQSRLANP